jgi:hypothetical protein
LPPNAPGAGSSDATRGCHPQDIRVLFSFSSVLERSALWDEPLHMTDNPILSATRQAEDVDAASRAGKNFMAPWYAWRLVFWVESAACAFILGGIGTFFYFLLNRQAMPQPYFWFCFGVFGLAYVLLTPRRRHDLRWRHCSSLFGQWVFWALSSNRCLGCAQLIFDRSPPHGYLQETEKYGRPLRNCANCGHDLTKCGP